MAFPRSWTNLLLKELYRKATILRFEDVPVLSLRHQPSKYILSIGWQRRRNMKSSFGELKNNVNILDHGLHGLYMASRSSLGNRMSGNG